MRTVVTLATATALFWQSLAGAASAPAQAVGLLRAEFRFGGESRAPEGSIKLSLVPNDRWNAPMQSVGPLGVDFVSYTTHIRGSELDLLGAPVVQWRISPEGELERVAKSTDNGDKSKISTAAWIVGGAAVAVGVVVLLARAAMSKGADDTGNHPPQN